MFLCAYVVYFSTAAGLVINNKEAHRQDIGKKDQGHLLYHVANRYKIQPHTALLGDCLHSLKKCSAIITQRRKLMLCKRPGGKLKKPFPTTKESIMS